MIDTDNIQDWRRKGREVTTLAARLRGQLRAGEILPGRFLSPVRALAVQHGVSTVTVNRALKLLAEEGLLTVRPRKGYIVRPGAADPDRGLPLAYVNTTRHAAGRSRDYFHRQLLAEFQRVAGERGWALLVLDADRMSPVEIAARIRDARTSGIVTNASSEELWTAIMATDVPMILVDAWSETARWDGVLQDGFMGGLQAARHLMDSGHTRIAWIGPPLTSGNLQILERFSGAHSALLARQRTFAARAEAPLGDTATAKALAHSLLRRKNRPTAILALWQDLTRAVMEAAVELRLKPGKDFELVGWCTEEEYDSFYSSFAPAGSPPTTVVWSIARMANVAVERLKQRRAAPHWTPLKLRIPTELRRHNPKN